MVRVFSCPPHVTSVTRNQLDTQPRCTYYMYIGTTNKERISEMRDFDILAGALRNIARYEGGHVTTDMFALLVIEMPAETVSAWEVGGETWFTVKNRSAGATITETVHSLASIEWAGYLVEQVMVELRCMADNVQHGVTYQPW